MGWICKKIKLPSLLGMMITGMILGPYVLNLLDDSILGISAELRKIALIIILTRAGLGLDLSGLKKIGRPAVMMCFVPATFEIVGIVLLAPKLMGLSILEAAIMGAVLAAVSPAVVVPRMVKLMEEGYGVKQGIPQLILAGASVDDVYVIVLFSTFTGMMQGQSTSILSFINIPVSIFLGIGIGLLIGTCLAYYFKKVHIRDTSKVLIILSISLLLVVMEAAQAQRIADEQGLDLVKISPQATPPVCKLMDYGKFRFEQGKREKEAKKNQHVVEIKEIRMSPGIDVGDFNTKLKNAQKFLADGNRVKVSVRFRGREMAHTDIGKDLLVRFAEQCAEVATLDKEPKLEGRSMSIFLSPKTGK